MIELTDAELTRVLNALAESSYYEPDHDLVDSVREMLLSKVENNES